MQDIREEMKHQFQVACNQLKQEKTLAMQNTELIGWLYEANAQVNLNLSETAYLGALGLTKDQYYTRAMAARVMKRFPAYARSYRSGEVGLSVLAMVAPKITEANQEVILTNIRGQSKRAARLFLSKVTVKGEIREGDGTAEITLTLRESDLAKLEEARSVLSARGKVPTNAEVLLRALDDLLDRRDPVRRAARAEERAQRKSRSAGSDRNEEKRDAKPKVLKKSTIERTTRLEPRSGPKKNQRPRPAIPREIQHRVWLRDGRRCTHRYPDGQCCEERTMLELDHIVPWSRQPEHALGSIYKRGLITPCDFFKGGTPFFQFFFGLSKPKLNTC